MEHPQLVHDRCVRPHSKLAQGHHAACASAFRQLIFRKDGHDLPEGIPVGERPTIAHNPVRFLFGENGEIAMEQCFPPPRPTVPRL